MKLKRSRKPQRKSEKKTFIDGERQLMLRLFIEQLMRQCDLTPGEDRTIRAKYGLAGPVLQIDEIAQSFGEPPAVINKEWISGIEKMADRVKLLDEISGEGGRKLFSFFRELIP
ncbi:MAG TPA: hypothetical protein VMU07_03600 [Candidatus Paceibacterota bacterium]|nr:hypothetical protein [Candidatus Paceibacterota bacterium]